MLNLLDISAKVENEKKDQMLTYGKACVGSLPLDISVPLLTAWLDLNSFSFLWSCTVQPTAKIMFFTLVLKAKTSLYLIKKHNSVSAFIRINLMPSVVPFPSSRPTCMFVDFPKNIFQWPTVTWKCLGTSSPFNNLIALWIRKYWE